jgi:uncharacterized protein YjbI with pentapeptide repeats
VRGATFQHGSFGRSSGITLAQLYSTASYQAHDLSGISLFGHNLAGANFAGQNLANANFSYATLTGADFTEANLADANFFYATLSDADFSHAILSGAYIYSATLTGANFGEANLTYVTFGRANLTGADFHKANLANAIFYEDTFTGTDFSAADARGATYLDLSSATTTNLIRPDGHINGLVLDGGGLLVVRDYDGNANPPHPLPPIPPLSIVTDDHFAMGPGGTLRMVFEVDGWDSTISFAPGIPVTLGGTLELTFADNVNLAGQLGRTFDLFNWTGVTPTGVFAISSRYMWDLSNLYSTGEITLIAVPEPATARLLLASGIAVVIRRRSRIMR